MGCDIHALIEVDGRYGWTCAGEPDIGRNYAIFSVLGNVRNYDDVIPFIAERRFPEDRDTEEWWDCSDAFRGLATEWDGDGYSHSWVTLREMMDFDVTQTVYNHNLILSKDEEGNITSIRAATNGSHMGEVGECSIFGPWGPKHWLQLIDDITKIANAYKQKDPDKIRLVFFFDN